MNWSRELFIVEEHLNLKLLSANQSGVLVSNYGLDDEDDDDDDLLLLSLTRL